MRADGPSPVKPLNDRQELVKSLLKLNPAERPTIDQANLGVTIQGASPTLRLVTPLRGNVKGSLQTWWDSSLRQHKIVNEGVKQRRSVVEDRASQARVCPAPMRPGLGTSFLAAACLGLCAEGTISRRMQTRNLEHERICVRLPDRLPRKESGSGDSCAGFQWL